MYISGEICTFPVKVVHFQWKLNTSSESCTLPVKICTFRVKIVHFQWILYTSSENWTFLVKFVHFERKLHIPSKKERNGKFPFHSGWKLQYLKIYAMDFITPSLVKWPILPMKAIVDKCKKLEMSRNVKLSSPWWN